MLPSQSHPSLLSTGTLSSNAYHSIHNVIPILMSTNSQIEIAQVCDRVKDLLLQKNAKYGDSALDPVRIMSKSHTTEQLCVRIDDKLSRIKSGAGLLATDEDVVLDLIGYFVLLKVALDRDTKDCYTDWTD